MSKAKKGTKAQAEDTTWDEGLISERADDVSLGIAYLASYIGIGIKGLGGVGTFR